MVYFSLIFFWFWFDIILVFWCFYVFDSSLDYIVYVIIYLYIILWRVFGLCLFFFFFLLRPCLLQVLRLPLCLILYCFLILDCIWCVSILINFWLCLVVCSASGVLRCSGDFWSWLYLAFCVFVFVFLVLLVCVLLVFSCIKKIQAFCSWILFGVLLVS